MARLRRLRDSIFILVVGTLGALFSAEGTAQQNSANPKATPTEDTQKAWSLRLPADQKVSFAGQVNMDTAGMPSSSMLYPVPGVGGLIVAVLTHGAIVEAAKKEQKEKLQQSANVVLGPYQQTLDGFTYQELTELTLARPLLKERVKLYQTTASSGDAVLLESNPRFLFTQDMTAIVLDNEITINHADGGSSSSYRTVVRVISSATTHDQITPFWLADAGKKIKQQSAALLAESLDIALSSFAGRTQKNETPHRTFRYMEGTVEKIERGQFLSSRCHRTVVTSLRGTFISFPGSQLELPTSETKDSCSQELAAVTQ